MHCDTPDFNLINFFVARWLVQLTPAAARSGGLSDVAPYEAQKSI